MELIVIHDSITGGYTIYLKKLPEVLAEGETIKKAKKNLAKTLYDIVLSGEIIKYKTDEKNNW